MRFLAVYLLSALGGSVLFYFLAPPAQPALGASGAIFGLFGAWFVVSRRLRVDTRAIVFLIVLNLAISFAVPSHRLAGPRRRADHRRACSPPPTPTRRGKHRTLIQVGATVAIVVIAAGRRP